MTYEKKLKLIKQWSGQKVLPGELHTARIKDQARKQAAAINGIMSIVKYAQEVIKNVQ